MTSCTTHAPDSLLDDNSTDFVIAEASEDNKEEDVVMDSEAIADMIMDDEMVPLKEAEDRDGHGHHHHHGHHHGKGHDHGYAPPALQFDEDTFYSPPAYSSPFQAHRRTAPGAPASPADQPYRTKTAPASNALPSAASDNKNRPNSAGLTQSNFPSSFDDFFSSLDGFKGWSR